MRIKCLYFYIALLTSVKVSDIKTRHDEGAIWDRLHGVITFKGELFPNFFLKILLYLSISKRFNSITLNVLVVHNKLKGKILIS